MSTPNSPAGQGPPAQQSGAAPQPAQQGAAAGRPVQQGQQNTQPAAQSKGKGVGQGPTAARSSWNTPRLLRLARAGAATAVLLTGVAATGTFSTDGLNATPDVIAQQWVAAERAGVEIAQADLRTAERIAGGDQQGARDSFDDAVTQVGTDLTSLGTDRFESGEIAREWSTFVLGAERAVAAAQNAASPGSESVTAVYGTASQVSGSAVERTDQVAERHAQDLRTGSRSMLTGTVGTVATLGLVGLMVWLALRTRRIVNVPLLLATAITAGLTYLSFNPSALPLTYDQRLADTTAAATALQEVYQARTTQHALTPGQGDRWPDEAAEAGRAVGAGDARTLWEEIVEATPEPGGEAVSATQATFTQLETVLRDRLDDQLDTAVAAVGRPAGITSGVALLLGLVGAGLAWTGLTRRLRDYR
ncbi:hypothetical protein [Ornithinimicrobium sufpigmenti]|uniref:hypothetical protein n=1 Tax=Ornithinimicrobium sufpigmenti TaxID=2508882 RepID=UPI00103682BA|nr:MULTISPECIES: hypothetical protein [unclassified Ornithinimicrobium]